MPRSEEIAKGDRSKNGKRPKKGKVDGQFRFINFNWTEDDKRRVELWLDQSEQPWYYVEELVGAGYRVGVAYDEYNDCYSASITNRSGPVEFRNACITARGGTAWSALTRVLGLHYAIAAETWTSLESKPTGDDLW